jgi:hypothetical protein
MVDIQTASLTVIGPLSRILSDLAFRADGTLYGITGTADRAPGEIVMVNTLDASVVGTGIVRGGCQGGSSGGWGGHSIAFGPRTGLLYHAHAPIISLLEGIDVDTGEVTLVGAGLASSAFQSLIFHPSGAYLLGSSWGNIYSIDPDAGGSTFLGTSGHCLTGMAFVTASPDCNANGVPDECDHIPAGDFDADGDVDLHDYAALADCLGGPGSPPAALMPCRSLCRDAFDGDGDGDVDLQDFGLFQQQFTGPNAA